MLNRHGAGGYFIDSAYGTFSLLQKVPLDSARLEASLYPLGLKCLLDLIYSAT